MVENPNLCSKAVLLEQRAEVMYEFNLILLRPNARRHSTVLIRIHFILRSDGLHGDAFRSISLEELDEIL